MSRLASATRPPCSIRRRQRPFARPSFFAGTVAGIDGSSRPPRASLDSRHGGDQALPMPSIQDHREALRQAETRVRQIKVSL
jgi:hypothetical protein